MPTVSNNRVCLERVKGIEPSSQAWEARILPMNYTRTALLTKNTIPYFIKKSKAITNFVFFLCLSLFFAPRTGAFLFVGISELREKCAKCRFCRDLSPFDKKHRLSAAEKIYSWSMKVYVEYALADNLFFDWLLVRLTARLTKIPVRGGRIFLAAAVGAVGAVASALTEGVWAVVAKIAVFVAIVAVAFGSRRIKKTFLAAAVFAFITFAAGGTIIALFNLFKVDYVAGVGLYYLSPVPIGFVGLGTLVFLALLRSVAAYVRRVRKIKRFGCKVTVEFNGVAVDLVGLIDSGNGLTDKGIPVCFVCSTPASKKLKNLVTQGVISGAPPKNFHYVSFATVSGADEVAVFEADKTTINDLSVRTFLAFSPTRGDGFDCLVNYYLSEEKV